VRYLITFACYGAHIHGDESGSVDRRHNIPNTRSVEADPDRSATERRSMEQEPYLLDGDHRVAVLTAIHEVCQFRGWQLFAAHVRSNHVHAVINGEPKPERILNDLKSYASRRLNRMGFDPPNRRRWAHHGSTRWLWQLEDVLGAIRYVVDQQGEPMSVFVAAPELLPGNRPQVKAPTP
jgi:REP element-mobilizing transposase RayT